MDRIICIAAIIATSLVSGCAAPELEAFQDPDAEGRPEADRGSALTEDRAPHDEAANGSSTTAPASQPEGQAPRAADNGTTSPQRPAPPPEPLLQETLQGEIKQSYDAVCIVPGQSGGHHEFENYAPPRINATNATQAVLLLDWEPSGPDTEVLRLQAQPNGTSWGQQSGVIFVQGGPPLVLELDAAQLQSLGPDFRVWAYLPPACEGQDGPLHSAAADLPWSVTATLWA